MIDPFLNIHSYARTMMIEQIMALHGRASKEPVRYRRWLESAEIETLRRILEHFTHGHCGSASSVIEVEAITQTAGERPAQFPAPSLTENAGAIASADIGHAPGSVREALTLQTNLP